MLWLWMNNLHDYYLSLHLTCLKKKTTEDPGNNNPDPYFQNKFQTIDKILNEKKEK